MELRGRNTKVIATVGPSSYDYEKLEQLHRAGADVFRINMSHTSHELLADFHERIRSVEKQVGRPLGILVDLQGPKIRVGSFVDGKARLESGSSYRFDLDDAPGDETRAPLPHPEIFSSLEPGMPILLDDGRISLSVTEVGTDFALAHIDIGGALTNRKGVNLPEAVLPVAALTNKDRADLEFAMELDVDWVALSFVQTAEDLAEARKLIAGRAALMAKIERPPALKALDQILDQCDGLMVARGDLGVELPIQKVPGWQKEITRAARRAGKPVVVATQMLESMIDSPVPTRAEVSDVATAIFEGTDAVMLSAESAAGAFPREAVAMMHEIARTIETDPNYRGIIDAQRTDPEPTTADAMMAAARQIADTVQTAAIVCYTNSGSTGIRAARERPSVPIVALTPVIKTGRRLALIWGLHCVLTDDAKDLDDMVDRACRIAFQEGIAKRGQKIIVTAGVPLGTPGATNLLRVAYVGGKSPPSNS